MQLDKVTVSTTGSSVNVSLLELAVELASAATYETLTAEYGDISEEAKEIRFSEDHLYSVDNGDIYYMEVAQDVFIDFLDYYEKILINLFDIKEVENDV